MTNHIQFSYRGSLPKSSVVDGTSDVMNVRLIGGSSNLQLPCSYHS